MRAICRQRCHAALPSFIDMPCLRYLIIAADITLLPLFSPCRLTPLPIPPLLFRRHHFDDDFQRCCYIAFIIIYMAPLLHFCHMLYAARC